MKDKIWEHYFKIQNSIKTGTPFGSELTLRAFLIETIFLDLCKSFKVKKVLDIGCAMGVTIDFFKSFGYETYGININKNEINNVKKELKRFIKYGDMHDIPFPDKSFDAIYCSHTFEHSLSPYMALCEFNRILKKDGLLFILLPEEGDYFTTHYGHFFCPTIMQMAGLLNKTGFSDLRQFRIEQIFNPIELKRNLCFIWKKDIDWDKKKNDGIHFIPEEQAEWSISLKYKEKKDTPLLRRNIKIIEIYLLRHKYESELLKKREKMVKLKKNQ